MEERQRLSRRADHPMDREIRRHVGCETRDDVRPSIGRVFGESEEIERRE